MIDERAVYFEGWHDAPVYDGRAIPIDEAIDGPAIVEGGQSTLVCPPAWTVSADRRGALHLDKRESTGGGDR